MQSSLQTQNSEIILSTEDILAHDFENVGRVNVINELSREGLEE